MTESKDSSVSSEPETAERIVIIDKRKVNPEGAAPQAAKPEAEAAGDGAVMTEQASPEEPKEASTQAHPDGELVDAGTATDHSPEQAEPAGEAAEAAGLGELRSALEERTADLQRITAEYANYRRRVDRDRTVASEQAVGLVLASLLPILDDLDRAREHGDLTGPFAGVADQLNTAVAKFGLTAFGSKGDPFDPNRHEAVAHLTSPDVSEPTCIDVMRRGYLLGEKLLRPAMVAVADPAEAAE